MGRPNGVNADANSSGVVISGEFRPRFARFFARYVRGMFARKFNAVRITPDSREQLRALSGFDGPLIVLLNHASWWDPLVCVLLGDLEITGRSAMAPMEAAQLRRFRFFRKLGLFGIEAQNREGMRAMCDYAVERFRREPRPTLWITPQGEFTDVRAPLRLRPGAAAVAARAPGCRVLSVAIEYAFWVDQKPEVFIRTQTVAQPAKVPGPSGVPTTRDWQRAMSEAMAENARQLASLVIARDPSAFGRLVGNDAASIHPVYDWWLRVRGKAGAIRPTTRPTTRTDKRTTGALQ